eukprot:3262247-Rhodomonas_salina.1
MRGTDENSCDALPGTAVAVGVRNAAMRLRNTLYQCSSAPAPRPGLTSGMAIQGSTPTGGSWRGAAACSTAHTTPARPSRSRPSRLRTQRALALVLSTRRSSSCKSRAGQSTTARCWSGRWCIASIYGGNASGNAAGGAQTAASAGLQVHSIVPIIIGEERRLRLEPSESADGSM